MKASTTSFAFGGERQPAEVIPFPRAAPRRFRREADGTSAPLGRILLFTGVRYERMTEAEAPLPQRRRS